MKNYIFLFLFLFVSFEILAQKKSKFVDVYVVTNNNDTIYGFVKSRFLKYSDFLFLKFISKKNEHIKYKPFDIKLFKIGDNTFESVFFDDGPCLTCTRKIFIPRYIDGPMILYKYQDSKATVNLLTGRTNSKCIVYYYVRKANDKSAILTYKELCENEYLHLITQPLNFDKFCQYFSEYPDLMNKIKDKTFERKDIEKIVLIYNNKISRK